MKKLFSWRLCEFCIMPKPIFYISLTWFFSYSKLFLIVSIDFAILHLYILYIYIANPWKKNVYIVCGPFTTECLGVVFFFLFVWIHSSTRYPIDCVSVSVLALSLLIRVKLDNRGNSDIKMLVSKIRSFYICRMIVFLVNPRFKNKTNKK